MTLSKPLTSNETDLDEERIRVAVVADNIKEREMLSEMVGGSRRFRLTSSVSSKQGENAIPVEATDLLIGHATDEESFGNFLSIANALAKVPSVLFVSGLSDLPLEVQDSAIDAVEEISDLSEQKLMTARLNSVANRPNVSGVPKSEARQRDEKILASLTEREREVLVLTANGLSMKEIAKELKRSYGTVASHRASLMDKTGVHDKVGLTRFAIRMQLIAA